MKFILTIILAWSLASSVEANNHGVTLNEAVNEVKSQGRVLSAKTIDGQHEIKILTPSGTVKTVKKHAHSRSQDSPSYQRRRDWSADFQKENSFDDLKRQRGYPVNGQSKNSRNINQNRQQNNADNRRRQDNNRSRQNNRNDRPSRGKQKDNNNRERNR